MLWLYKVIKKPSKSPIKKKSSAWAQPLVGIRKARVEDMFSLSLSCASASTSQILRSSGFPLSLLFVSIILGFLRCHWVHSHSFCTVQHDVNMMLNGNIPRGSGAIGKGLLLGSGTPMLLVSFMALCFHQSQGQKRGPSLSILVERWKHRHLKQLEMPTEHSVSQK